jgi:hypothetical protein
MKNLNEKRKTESGIRMFNECDSTVWELRNPEDIGVAGINMHLARFAVSARTKFQKGMRVHHGNQMDNGLLNSLIIGNHWLDWVTIVGKLQ